MSNLIAILVQTDKLQTILKFELTKITSTPEE